MSEYQRPNENRSSLRKLGAWVLVTFVIIFVIFKIQDSSNASFRDRGFSGKEQKYPNSSPDDSFFGKEEKHQKSYFHKDEYRVPHDSTRPTITQQQIDLIKGSLKRPASKASDFSAALFAKPWFLYDFLDVSITATPQEIKKAYFKVSKEVHPDRQSSVSEERKEYFTNAFKMVQRSYSILSDDQKRYIYDLSSIASIVDSHFPFTEEMEKLNKNGTF